MKRLPPRPDLGHLKKQAKTLLAEARAGDAAALARLVPLALPAGTDLRLHHAQWCLAREHGFASWPQFQAFVLARCALADDPQRSLATWLRWVYAGDIAGGADNARPEVAARLLDEGLVSLPADDPMQRKPDIALARSKLDWEPVVPLRDGLVQTIAYFDQLLSQR